MFFNVSHFFIAVPGYVRGICPNLQESPNTGKRTCSYRLSPTSHPSTITCPCTHPQFSSPDAPHGLEFYSGSGRQVLGRSNPCLSNTPTAAKARENHAAQPRNAGQAGLFLSLLAQIKWVIHFSPDVPKTLMILGVGGLGGTGEMIPRWRSWRPSVCSRFSRSEVCHLFQCLDSSSQLHSACQLNTNHT